VAKDTHNLSSRGAIRLGSLGLVQLRGTAQPRLSIQYVSHWPSILPPPPHLTADMRGELLVYILSPEEEFLRTQWCCRMVLTLSSSATMTTSLFFIIPWERVSWPFLGCFKLGPLGFLKLFSSSPFESLWLLLTQSSHTPGHHKTHLIWVDSSLMAPLELSLVFKHLWPPLTRSSLSPDCPENYLLWVDLILTFPFGLHADSPLELLRTVSASLCIVHILYIVHSATTIHQFCFAII
jgi:hypothetical protein